MARKASRPKKAHSGVAPFRRRKPNQHNIFGALFVVCISVGLMCWIKQEANFEPVPSSAPYRLVHIEDRINDALGEVKESGDLERLFVALAKNRDFQDHFWEKAPLLLSNLSTKGRLSSRG